MHFRWFIKAQVMNKVIFDDSTGKYLSFVLIDKSGQIKCTAYRDQCDKICDIIKVNYFYCYFLD